MTDAPEDDQSSLGHLLGNFVSYVTNEALVLAQYELAHKGEFPGVWPDSSNEAFEKRMGQVEHALGGPPEYYLLRDDEEPPAADNYPYAALNEAVQVFYRARKSVVRAHLFMTGASILSEQPDVMKLPDDPQGAALLVGQANSAFWEHAEAAYIRLYSFWDRVGQVLDFAYFNIRKFDQNGFYAVMERIAANAVPMNRALKSSASWTRLKAFQSSEREDGLKWLLQRRNLLVHSLHLHPVKANQESMFASQFNHLEITHREKLRPRDAQGETDLLMTHLKRAAALFPDVLTVLEYARTRPTGNGRFG